MNSLKLVLPTPKYREKIMDYKREFIENGEIMHGTAGLRNAESFEEWYSVRKSERQQGYATAKTIINNGGKLENEVPEGDGITQRYWITLA